MCVVRNNTESRIGGIFLHNPSKRHLRSSRHRIGLVENDQFECPQGILLCGGSGHGKDLFCACKSLDLFADYVDASVVGCVELQDHLSHVFAAIDSSGEGEDCSGFSSTGGPVKEEMW